MIGFLTKFSIKSYIFCIWSTICQLFLRKCPTKCSQSIINRDYDHSFACKNSSRPIIRGSGLKSSAMEKNYDRQLSGGISMFANLNEK